MGRSCSVSLVLRGLDQKLTISDASFCVVCAFFGYFFCPETKGLTLEQMVSNMELGCVID